MRLLVLACLTLALACGPVAAQEAQGSPTVEAPAPMSLDEELARGRELVGGGALSDAESADLLLALAGKLAQAGRVAEAEAMVGEALARVEAAAGKDDQVRVEALRKAADIMQAAGRPAVAVAHLERARRLQEPMGPDAPARRFVLEDLAQALEAAGQLRDVPRLRAEAARLEGLEAGRDKAVVTMGGGKDETRAGYELVSVNYVTTRRRTGLKDPYRAYSGEAGPIVYGRARVSVPRVRELGSVPRPNVWMLEFRPDPNQHVTLTSVTEVRDRATFVGGLANQIARSKRKEAFVFIHGFNTKFDGAAMRAAQLAIDLEIDGAPILFSWPSRGELLAYGQDEVQSTSEAAVTALAQLLEDVATRTGAQRIYVVAHSMGNRPTLRALARIRSLKPPAGRQTLLDEVVFAAPDVPQAEFRTRVTQLRGLSPRMTLYASRRDRALQVSAMVNQAQRAGDATPPIVLPGVIDTVDTTAATMGLLGHTDFAGTARDDLRAVLWAGLAPTRRCQISAVGSSVWSFERKSCDDGAFRAAIWFWRRAGGTQGAIAAFDKAIADFQARASAGGEAAQAAVRSLAAYRQARTVLQQLGLP